MRSKVEHDLILSIGKWMDCEKSLDMKGLWRGGAEKRTWWCQLERKLISTVDQVHCSKLHFDERFQRQKCFALALVKWITYDVIFVAPSVFLHSPCIARQVFLKLGCWMQPAPDTCLLQMVHMNTGYTGSKQISHCSAWTENYCITLRDRLGV